MDEENAGISEEEPFIPIEVKVSKKRWWVLFVFSGLGFMQCAVWNTWGPITDSVKFAYQEWTNSEIALLSMWGTITMLTALIPFTYMLQSQGMRLSMLVSSALVAMGSLVRLFAMGEKSFTILAHVGSILNGFGGIIIGAAPSLLSSLWFPPHERTTATAIGCTFNQLGNAGGFFLGPLIVKQPDRNQSDDIAREVTRISIRNYMWIAAGLCIPFFFFVLVYFPDKPRRPPSLTSAIQESTTSMYQDVCLLFKKRNFWLMIVPYSLTLGINVAWSSVIDINVAPAGVSQDEASLMGVYMTLGGVVLAVVVSRFTDLLYGYIKLTIIGLQVVATLGFLWFLFIMNGCIPFSENQLLASSVIGASFSYATSPLFFELAVELAYPVPEGIVGSFLTMSWNLVAAIFLAILQFTPSNVLWMNYVLASAGGVALFLMIFVKEQYLRSALDNVPNSTVEAQDDDESPLLAELFTTL